MVGKVSLKITTVSVESGRPVASFELSCKAEWKWRHWYKSLDFSKPNEGLLFLQVHGSLESVLFKTDVKELDLVLVECL